MITVIGEALIDLVESAQSAGAVSSSRTFTALAGGSPLNVAVGLARLEQPTSLLGRLSADGFGRLLRSHAERNGVGLSAAVKAPEPTTLAIATLDDQGRADYEFYVNGTADWQWTDAELAAVPADTAVLHFGSLASWMPPGNHHIAALVRRLRAERGVLISYDPNVRPGLLGSAERGRSEVETAVPLAHLVKASEEDLAWLYPGEPAAAVANRWLAMGPDLVVITRGGAGAVAYCRNAQVERPAPPITLIDTVGAGDAFTAGLLDALVRAGASTADGFAAITADPARIAALLDRAIVVAAITCTREGADPPRRSELPTEL